MRLRIALWLGRVPAAMGPFIGMVSCLPPTAEPVEEHVLEAASRRVPGTLDHRSELWDECYDDLMEQARTRLRQELLRLGGNYAHVLDEIVGKPE